ncbi:MAG TPA: glutamine--fructose-6-phosphate transaminase (isomerizing) [Candidatus Thermoplasmatota archaeon]|nr:glutamine--fructose-6-phosphate transaminase (isomerizing) [Candidatus Thermoplasmatota archaeon]
MCGIVGVFGLPQASLIVRRGLERLEYRGYDSAGVAWLDETGIEVLKAVGRVREIPPNAAGGETVAIGHTRWATHGGVTYDNAHPHLDGTGRFSVVHNGTIEGHHHIRGKLEADGHTFKGETDTEVIAHLYERARRKHDPLAALRIVTGQMEGSWALGILDAEAKVIAFARNRTPLILAFKEADATPAGAAAAAPAKPRRKGFFGGADAPQPAPAQSMEASGGRAILLASDVTAILEQTRRVVYLDEGDHGIISKDGVELYDAQGKPKALDVRTVDWDVRQAEKSGYPHFMLKEIHEAPTAINQCLAGRIRFDPLRFDAGVTPALLASVRRIRLVACGTSYHAALMARHYLEHWARIPTEAIIASDLRERPVLDEPGMLYIGVSQSGETLDTLEALRHVAAEGYPVLAVTNVQGSSLQRMADETVLTRVGPEVGVAATKTLLGQVATLAVLALQIAQERQTLDPTTLDRLGHELSRLPRVLSEVLEKEEELKALGQKLAKSRDLFFLGRGVHVATAYEAALKFKEITYRHAEGFGSAELKHGPFALLSEETPCVFFVPEDHKERSKVVSNMVEVAARGAPVYAISLGPSADIQGIADTVVELKGGSAKAALVFSLAGQVLSYYAASALGANIDMPRNLAKSVTVE